MLRLYKGITPNRDANHYLFNSLSMYETALSPYLVASVVVDNYRVNTNVIKVALNNTLTEAKACILSYVIDERANSFKCYIVKSVAIQSGFAVLDCEVDNWATYLMNADISNINVLRCNRNLGEGLLDDIAAATHAPTKSYCAVAGSSDEGSTPNALMARDRVYIVFALKYNIQQNAAGAVSHIALYAFKVADLVQWLYEANAEEEHPEYYLLVNPVELAIDVISGIYGIVGTNMWSIMGTLNAVVLGAWFTDNVAVVGATNMQIKAKPNWHNWNDVTLTPYEVIKTEVSKNLIIDNNVNKQYYVGTLQNGLKLTRTTATQYQVVIKTIPSNDKLTILAMQGDNQLDITDSFAVTIGTADGDVTAERQVLDVVQNSVRAIAGAITLGKGVASGNAFATALGVTSLAGSLTDEIAKGRSGHLGNQVKGGDGAIAYWRLVQGPGALDQPIRNAYVVNAYSSNELEDVHLRMFGAKYNAKISSLHYLKALALLGTGTNSDPTYLEANAAVGGVPLDAANEIKNHLSHGVRLIDLI